MPRKFLRLRCLCLLAALGTLLAVSPPARAWNAQGHMLVAAMAYDQLPPPQRARLLTLLASHPDFAKWQAAAPKDVPGFEFARYAFMRASTWPDDIRKTGSPYDHPPWHYVQFPLVPPAFPMEEPPAVENILTAIAHSENVVADASATGLDRAASLCWTAHLVGDIMQPLHGGTFIGEGHPKPDGDHNGNAFFVNLAGNAVNLHSYWDGLGGTMLDTHELIGRAADLQRKFPRAELPELDRARDPRGWALESRQLAIDAVYLRGALPGSYETLAVLPALPGDYAAAGRKLAERRLALAGYRLADELSRAQIRENMQIYTLTNDAGCEARITDYGGILVSLTVPDRHGRFDDVVLGFDGIDDYLAEDYLKENPYFGALIGRYANRIGKARFTLDGKTHLLSANNGQNTLHGGRRGFEQRVWRALPREGPPDTLELTYVSEDGEEGFPGKVSVHARYMLAGTALKIEFTAVTDQPTVINLTNHSYFNLRGAGNGDVLDHALQIEADAYTPVDAESIPLPGAPATVEGTPFDFREPTKIGSRIDADDVQIKNGKGYDHNFVLRGSGLRTIANVTESTTGRGLAVESDQPGVQFYSGNFLDGTITGKGGKVYEKRAAFCLEPQRFPDSPNRPDFPSVVLRPGETYRHTMAYRFYTLK